MNIKSSHWKVFLEINLNKKHWNFIPLECSERNNADRLSRSMLWSNHEYQYSADIFVIFKPVHWPGLFLYFLKYIRKPEVSWCFQRVLKEIRAMISVMITSWRGRRGLMDWATVRELAQVGGDKAQEVVLYLSLQKHQFLIGPRTPPKNPFDCTFLDSWVFDNSILADILFAIALRSLETSLWFNKN